jgi:hypothetical protein
MESAIVNVKIAYYYDNPSKSHLMNYWQFGLRTYVLTHFITRLSTENLIAV